MEKFQRFFSVALVCILVFSLSLVAVDAKGSEGRGHEQGKGKSDEREWIEVKFKDTDDALWANEYIDRMQALNVFTGYEDGTFRPNQPVKRIEAIVMAVRLMGLEGEVEKQDKNKELHFKDANHIEKKYPWAKGYVLVALENGLFDASEDSLQPEKAASRVWISSLLVRALDLQDEALKQMTAIPNFKDAKAIPAGSIGYVNVAVEKGIVTGYPNGNFQPNKPVTRAEMAALLDRTNDDLLDKDGALTVKGKVTNITFNKDTAGNKTDGKITILTHDNKVWTYDISPNLLVKYKNRYIRAEQIYKDDEIVLVVKDGAVREASIVDSKPANPEPEKDQPASIVKLEIEAEMKDGSKAEWEYKSKNGKVEAEIELETKNEKRKLKGKEARELMGSLIKQLDIDASMKDEDILKSVIKHFIKGDIKNLEELEIKIEFSNGKKVEIEWEDESDNRRK